MPTQNLPAVTGSKAVAGLAGKQKRFVTILKDDFNFDVIESIVKHIRQIDRAKKIKPLEKARLLQNYYLTLLNYCIPKMKLEEDKGDKVGDKISFSINIQNNTTDAKALPVSGGSASSKKKPDVSITIPTVKQPDGSYSPS